MRQSIVKPRVHRATQGNMIAEIRTADHQTSPFGAAGGSGAGAAGEGSAPLFQPCEADFPEGE